MIAKILPLAILPLLAFGQDKEGTEKSGVITGRPVDQIIAPYVPEATTTPLCTPLQDYPLAAVLPGFSRFDGPLEYSINLYILPSSVDPPRNEIVGGELSSDVLERLLDARLAGNAEPNYAVEVYAFDDGRCTLLDVFTGIGATLSAVPFYGSDEQGAVIGQVYQTNRPGELVAVADWPTFSRYRGNKYFAIRKPRDRAALRESLGIVDVPAVTQGGDQ